MLAPIVCCARAPQSSCNGDFVIDCRGTGGTCGIAHSDVLCYSVHVCAFATYQLILVWCMAWICMRPNLAGWGSPENCKFFGCVGTYSVRTDVLTRASAPSTPRAPHVLSSI